MNRLLPKSEFYKKFAKVFLCYSHTDRNAVRPLCSRLKKGGVEVWLDSEKLLPGQNWKDEIHEAIISSQVVLVCLSRNFNKQKGFRHEELKIALEKAAAEEAARADRSAGQQEDGAGADPDEQRGILRESLSQIEGVAQLIGGALQLGALRADG